MSVFTLWPVIASAATLAEIGSPEAIPLPSDLDLSELGRPEAVTGGNTAPAGQWDDAVALYTPTHQFACSGVLIAPDLVLTAGHCGTDLGAAVIGTTDLRRGGEQIRIAEIIVHPEPYATLDAAILRLERPATRVEPRVAALDCIAEEYVALGAEVVIVGFGAIDPWANDWTTSLQEGFTTITDPLCADLASGCYEQVSPGGEMIAGGGGIDSCSGDSGGPLYLPTPEGDYLVGITSRAKVPADTPCGSGGIYVRADALVDWIESETGQILPRPACEGRNRPPSPRSDGLEVVRGGTGVAVIDPHDPDLDQRHSYAIVLPPEHGLAQLDPEGAVYYLGPDTFVGEDRVVVEVTDDGDPPLSAELEIPIRVLPSERGTRVEPSGCHTAPEAGGWLLLAAALLRRRRR